MHFTHISIQRVEEERKVGENMNKYLKYKKKIDELGFTPDLINTIINAHKKDATRMKHLYDRYQVDEENGPAIFKRTEPLPNAFDSAPTVARLDDKVNNQLNNSFDADIVDTKVGYLFGHPISYSIDDTEGQFGKMQQVLEEFLLRNNTEDEDSELGKFATICGYGARLLYIDLEGHERIKLIDPWECILIGDEIQAPTYSIRYYIEDNIKYVECYDDTNIYFFEQDGSAFKATGEQAHLFDYNPLFGTANNRELKGDAEKVLSLIDAYDKTTSDVSNEIEQLRLAYLIIKGAGIEPEDLKKVNQSGIFELFGENDEIKYLTKDVNDTMIENHLKRLEKNILRFAKSVDFTSEEFGTSISGVALRFKLMALENKSITMERKFTSTLRYEMKVLFSAWAKRYGFNKEDYLKVFFGFKRNIPVNYLDEAQTSQALKGIVSEETRLSLLSFVDDVKYELEKMKDEEDIIGDRLGSLTNVDGEGD